MQPRIGWMRILAVLVVAFLLVTFPPLGSASPAAKATNEYDFVARAGQAQWRSGAGDLPFPGQDTDNRGFALHRQGAAMEDGATYSLVLETHPQWVDSGWIAGTYPPVTIAPGAELFVRVGFLNGAQNSDGVVFLVRAGEGGRRFVELVNLQAAYDGKLGETAVSLEAYANKTLTFELAVTAGASSGQDWAAWVSAQIRPTVSDTDQDGVPDAKDNCPQASNPAQTDADNDGTGDACDACDDRDPDGDGIRTCQDQCPSEPETYNNYLDQDGCPDTLPPTDTVVPPPTIEPPTVDWFGGIEEGPVMQEAFNDGDEDGVLNFEDECPDTPAAQVDYVYENGCLCVDTDGGRDRTAILRHGSVNARYAGGESACRDHCDGGTLSECYCNPDFERGLATTPILRTSVACADMGDLPSGASWTCSTDRCIPSMEAIPRYCFSGQGTCADGIQNQDETGVDCGGSCPPCNTMCTTGTRYAPSDTPCTSVYPDDPHEIEMYWTDSWLENPCQLYEICHPDLDYIIEEALGCCSIPNTYSGMTTDESEAEETARINAQPDPALCRAARQLTGHSTGCSRCVGIYIIEGFGPFARWMQGYTWLYPANDVEGVGALPAERLINDFHTGVCRDYSLAVATLLRKAGYPQNSVAGFCDGAHCYNVVKFPGDTLWHVIDTTGNSAGVSMGRLPSISYDYCRNLNESSRCFGGIQPDGDPCTGSELVTVGYPPLCQPGLACFRDTFTTPGWAAVTSQIVGCGTP